MDFCVLSSKTSIFCFDEFFGSFALWLFGFAWSFLHPLTHSLTPPQSLSLPQTTFFFVIAFSQLLDHRFRSSFVHSHACGAKNPSSTTCNHQSATQHMLLALQIHASGIAPRCVRSVVDVDGGHSFVTRPTPRRGNWDFVSASEW